jgi:ABC-type Fe3+/spermidine/putrescine transport system ATPase subunit
VTRNGDSAVRLIGARKTYGDVVAVDGVDLDIQAD